MAPTAVFDVKWRAAVCRVGCANTSQVYIIAYFEVYRKVPCYIHGVLNYVVTSAEFGRLRSSYKEDVSVYKCDSLFPFVPLWCRMFHYQAYVYC